MLLLQYSIIIIERNQKKGVVLNENKRTKQVGVSLTMEEFEKLRKCAFVEKKSMSCFIRDTLFKEIKKKEKRMQNDKKE